MISIREPEFSDETAFIHGVIQSKDLHHPWTTAPCSSKEFQDYIKRAKQLQNKSFLVIKDMHHIAGVFNISDIIRGSFQNAYLGYYVMHGYDTKGLMSEGLKLVLQKAFTELGLHRIEANIQPENVNSIRLVEKNGFRKEGYSPRYLKINNEWRDHERWAMTIEDWEQKNS